PARTQVVARHEPCAAEPSLRMMGPNQYYEGWWPSFQSAIASGQNAIALCLLFAQASFRKTGAHFSGSCGSLQAKARGESTMPRIKTFETGHYQIPLEVTLSDSTHGEIKAFELLTCRVRDSDGAEGVGYTYTVGRNGGAIADILRREIPQLVEGHEAD